MHLFALLLQPGPLGSQFLILTLQGLFLTIDKLFLGIERRAGLLQAALQFGLLLIGRFDGRIHACQISLQSLPVLIAEAQSGTGAGNGDNRQQHGQNRSLSRGVGLFGRRGLFFDHFSIDDLSIDGVLIMTGRFSLLAHCFSLIRFHG